MLEFWIKFLLFLASAILGGRAGAKDPEKLRLAEGVAALVSFVILIGSFGMWVFGVFPPAEYGFGYLLTPALGYFVFWFVPTTYIRINQD